MTHTKPTKDQYVNVQQRLREIISKWAELYSFALRAFGSNQTNDLQKFGEVLEKATCVFIDMRYSDYPCYTSDGDYTFFHKVVESRISEYKMCLDTRLERDNDLCKKGTLEDFKTSAQQCKELDTLYLRFLMYFQELHGKTKARSAITGRRHLVRFYWSLETRMFRDVDENLIKEDLMRVF